MDGRGPPRTAPPPLALGHPAAPAHSVAWTGAVSSGEDLRAVLPLPFGIRGLMTCRRPRVDQHYEALLGRAA